MKIKTFKTPIIYLDYIRLKSLYPPRGTKLGGTIIIIEVDNFPDD